MTLTQQRTHSTWTRSGSGWRRQRQGRGRQTKRGYDGGFSNPADAEFIAHAREDVPNLVQDIRDLRGYKAAWDELYYDLSDDVPQSREGAATRAAVVAHMDSLIRETT